MVDIESQSAYLALKENKPKAIHTHIQLFEIKLTLILLSGAG